MANPILQIAAEEIDAILEKYDLAMLGMILSAEEKKPVRVLGASWNCVTMLPGLKGLHVSNEGIADPEERAEKLRRTCHMLQTFGQAASNDTVAMVEMLGAILEKAGVGLPEAAV